MAYRLWLSDLECGVAADEDATTWRDTMREHGYDEVRIEPEPGAVAAFSFVEDEKRRRMTDCLLLSCVARNASR